MKLFTTDRGIARYHYTRSLLRSSTRLSLFSEIIRKKLPCGSPRFSDQRSGRGRFSTCSAYTLAITELIQVL